MNRKSEKQTPKPEEIIEALHVLQDTCNCFDMIGNACDCCPLATKMPAGVVCTVTDLSPCNWDIGEAPDKTWRAFK